MSCLIFFSAQATDNISPENVKYEIAQTPDWVEAVELSGEKNTFAAEAVQYLLTDNQIKVSELGQQSYRRFSFKLNEISAVADYSDIRVQFSPAYQSITFHNIQIRRGNKVLDQLSRDKIKIINTEQEQASKIYSGMVETLMFLEDVRVGDVVDYSYTITGTNPVFGNAFSNFTRLGWPLPVARISARILMPADRPLTYQAIKTNASVTQSTKAGYIEYKVQLDNTEKVIAENDLPSWFNPFPYIQFSEYKSWRQVSDWAVDLFKVKEAPNQELAAFIEKLKKLDQQQALLEAIRFTQDEIRYLGLELAENSHKPHAPNEVFNNRYGDCKDKTLLLVTLLRHIGVEAYPALVSTIDRHTINDYLATPDLFNHVIVKMTWQGKEHWIDPTINYQGKALETIYQPNYGMSLLVKPRTGRLSSAIPEKNLQAKAIVNETFWSVDYFSPVQWHIQTRYLGQEAERMRREFAQSGVDAVARNYMNYYAKRFPKIRQIKAMSFVDDSLANELTVNESYLVPGYWQHEEGDAYLSLYTDFITNFVQSPQTIQRTQPLALYGAIDIVHSATLMLPEHVNMGSLEQDILLEDDYITFDSTLHYDLRRLTLTNHYRNKKEFVPSKDSAEHIELLSKIRKRLEFNQGVTNVEQDKGINELSALMNSLNERMLNSNL